MDDLEHMLLDPSANPAYLQLSLLEAITDNFSDACHIGSGGFADVYMGQLRNGMVVAVKKLSKRVVIDENKFIQEADSLMRVNHKNIVRFLGYCSDTQEKMLNFKGKSVMAEERQRLLCFEFLPKGSLDKYITDASCGLEWHVRYDIIKGICFGLHYLHMQSNIAHMDLKPQNILMDDNMVAKIGDFGTSRLIDANKSMVTLNIMGTRGYMAPEYIENGLVSKKADIFSFGVIILELLTGSKHYDFTEESCMARYTLEVVGKWMKRLPNAAYSQQVCTCVLIAIECVSSEKDKRPTTEYIINKLIKVESEIREKLINEGQERAEGITNVTVGVVALVLVIPSWVLTIGVAVIVLLRLQNRMSSWPPVVAIDCASSDKDKRPTAERIITKLIKVKSEIREELTNEGQEWVMGITNVTVGVVVLVLILRSWVLTIGVAVIALVRLQNPVISWPRVVATECVSHDKDKRPTTKCIINKLIKVESEIREKLIIGGQECWSWMEGITNVTVGVIALVLILRSWVLTIGAAVIVLICLQNPMSSWPRVVWVILFGIGAVLLAVLILIWKVPTALLVERSQTILVKVAIFVGNILWHHKADLLTLLDKVVAAARVRVLSPKTLFLTIVSTLPSVLILMTVSTSWSWVAVTIMNAFTPMSLLAIAFVDKCVPEYHYRKSRAWIILFFATEAVHATLKAKLINLVNSIISLPLAATAYSVVKFLAAYRVIRFWLSIWGIQYTVQVLYLTLEIIKISRKGAILFVGGILHILLDGPITSLSWPTVDIMAVILLPLLWSTFSPLAALLLCPLAIALAADIVITRGIMGVFAIRAFYFIFITRLYP